jgi:hypothetical protein
VFGATIFFGTDKQRPKARVIHKARFNFVREVELWYERDQDQKFLPGNFQNKVVLTEEFFSEIMAHRIPVDIAAIRSLSNAPAVLDLFVWLCYRCFTATGEERIPLSGERGLVKQLGSVEYTRPRKFRQKLEEEWLKAVRAVWKKCPARLSDDGEYLLVRHARAIKSRPKKLEIVPDR